MPEGGNEVDIGAARLPGDDEQHDGDEADMDEMKAGQEEIEFKE